MGDPGYAETSGGGGLGRLEHGGGITGGWRELAVVRTEKAQPAVAVVAGAVLGHGAVVEHG